MSGRFDFRTVAPSEFWGDSAARRVIAENPGTELYTCAAGISPSGVVHFGNFRDIISSYVVVQALRRQGKKARLIFSWDNFDRFRKVPAGVPESFAEHVGKPLSKIPDPLGQLSSYAERFQAPFVEAMQELGIELEYLDQTKLYESGIYDEAVFHALTHRRDVARILLSFMTEKAKAAEGLDEAKYVEEFYPVSVYSRFTGKDNTEVLSYDGGTTITYRCKDTDKTESVDLSKEHIAKLGWKCDWAMRWRHERVHFEPGGHDHASPGGSYDTSSVIAKEVFGYEPPLFAEYKFVGVQGLGSKMSGSKGNAVSPGDLLEIYDPVLLKWLYLRKSPQQSFMLAFDSEVFRQYEEFDREAAAYAAGEGDSTLRLILDDSIGTLSVPQRNPIPFRQAVAFGQIVQWDGTKLGELLAASGLSYDADSIAKRLPRARAWLTKYNPDERIELLSEPNAARLAELAGDAKAQVRALHDALAAKDGQSVEELEVLVYGIPKKEGLAEAELKQRQRAFFKDVYQLLIGKDTGPRLGTFLWAVDRRKALELLAS